MKKVARLRMPPSQDLIDSHSGDSSVDAGADDSQREQQRAQTSTPSLGVRTTGRIKKPKLVYDPSDNYLPKYHRSSLQQNSVGNHSNSSNTSRNATSPPTANGATASKSKNDVKLLRKSDPPKAAVHVTSSRDSASSERSRTLTPVSGAAAEPLCEVCKKKQAKRGFTAKNKLIPCLGCKKQVHKLCLEVDFEDIDLLREQYRCKDCRTCDICSTSPGRDPKGKPVGPLVICSKCVKSFHITCHEPNVAEDQQSQRDWKCSTCLESKTNLSGNEALEESSTSAKDSKDEIQKHIVHESSADAEHDEDDDGDDPEFSINRKSPKPKALKVKNLLIRASEEVSLNKIKRKKNENKSISLGNAGGIKNVTNGSEAVVHKKVKDKPKKKDAIKEDQVSIKKPPALTATMEADTKPDSALLPPATPCASLMAGGSMSFINNIKSLPDVREWSHDQVADYFAQYFPRDAHVFRDQEIDGASLLLLRRSDVIKLPLKLGPSLRIYNLILRIQTKFNNPTVSWNCKS